MADSARNGTIQAAGRASRNLMRMSRRPAKDLASATRRRRRPAKRVGMGIGMGAMVGTAALLRRRRAHGPGAGKAAEGKAAAQRQPGGEAGPKTTRGHNGTEADASRRVRQAHR